MLLLQKTFILFCMLIIATPILAAKSGKMPNIVLFLTDDQGYAEMGCQGNTDIPTPNIDRLADNGVRFTEGYVTCSVCSPSRAGLLTGRYQNRFGYVKNFTAQLNDDPRYGLPGSEKTMAEFLLDAGYVSGIFGKWHLGATSPYHPYRHGFDEFFGFLHEGHYYVPMPYKGVTTRLRRSTLPWRDDSGLWTSADGKTVYIKWERDNESDYDANNPIIRGSQPVIEQEYLTNAFAREAVDFIDRNKDRPFFLYLPFSAVHSPMQGEDKYMEKFSHIEDINRRIFAAMLESLDDGIGRVMQKLRDENMEENTVVILLSDNGGPTTEITSSNYPLRGYKGSLYEGGIRVPFIIQWKNNLPHGKVYESPVISLDLLPTIAAIVDHPIDEERIDGINLLPFITESTDKEPHEFLYWSFEGKQALRKGDWKIVRPKKNAALELYNLATDIGESENMAGKYPDKVKELQGVWTDFTSRIKDEK